MTRRRRGYRPVPGRPIDPVKQAAGVLGALKRWKDVAPVTIRIGDLAPAERRLIRDLVRAVRDPDDGLGRLMRAERAAAAVVDAATRVDPTDHVLVAVRAERGRQERIGATKRAAGIDWRSCADPAMAGGDGSRYLVLGEEVGEVANAVLEMTYGTDGASDRHLRDELVQVAAVAVAWAEAIDARAE